MGIEDILMYDESLFQNINAFDPDYMPPNYNFRDTQMEAMAMAIRPAIRGGQPSNAIILGSPATGKQLQLERYSSLLKGQRKRLSAFILTVRFIQPVLEYFHKSSKSCSDICLQKQGFRSQESILKSCRNFK